MGRAVLSSSDCPVQAAKRFQPNGRIITIEINPVKLHPVTVSLPSCPFLSFADNRVMACLVLPAVDGRQVPWRFTSAFDVTREHCITKENPCSPEKSST